MISLHTNLSDSSIKSMFEENWTKFSPPYLIEHSFCGRGGGPSRIFRHNIKSICSHNPNSTSTQPQLNSTELGLAWKWVCTPPPKLNFHHEEPQINHWCCLNNNINIKDNNKNKKLGQHQNQTPVLSKRLFQVG